jgi:hypothetical protein
MVDKLLHGPTRGHHTFTVAWMVSRRAGGRTFSDLACGTGVHQIRSGGRIYHHLHRGRPHQGSPDRATEVPAVPPVAVASRASCPAPGVTSAAGTRKPDLAPSGAVEQLSWSIRVPRSILGNIVHKTLRQAKILRANSQVTETDVICRCRRGGNDTDVPQSRPSLTDRARRETGSRTSGGLRVFAACVPPPCTAPAPCLNRRPELAPAPAYPVRARDIG